MRGDSVKRKYLSSADKSPEQKEAASNGKAEKASDDKKPIFEPAKPPEDIEAFFEASKGRFWSKNGKQQWMEFSTDSMSCMLKNRGYWGRATAGQYCTQVEQYLHRIRFHNCIDWAGELAGWPTGRASIANLDVLITRGNKPIKPKRGKYPFIREFFLTLLGKEQLPYFLGWLKGSLQALTEGYPFRPGQLIAFAGDVNCGKSFAQLLITHVLGGRQGDPTEFLLGNTGFTADFFSAEHLMIEDKALKDFSHAKRRAFAANLKGLIVNQDQRIHPKGKEATLLPVGTRVTLSCNDAPEALAILPALDRDVSDKVIYFLCGEGALPMRTNQRMERGEQLQLFIKELPALVYFLQSYKVPEAVKDPGNRFSVRGYHNAKIIEKLHVLTPEQRLLQLVEVLELDWNYEGIKTGTAAEIEQWMRRKDSANQLDRILTYNASMGFLLSKLAKEGEERVKIEPSDGRKNRYSIFKNEL